MQTDELYCFEIFRRMGGKIILTEQGYRFLDHAKVMLREEEAIREVGMEKQASRLRVGVMNFSPAVDAFIRFISERKDVPLGDYVCINTSPEDGAKLLKEKVLDVVVSLQLKDMLALSEKMCRENKFLLTKFQTIPICVRLSRNHPLYSSGKLNGSLKSLQQLSNYPYADYKHLENIMSIFNQSAPVPFGCSYRIYVDERDTRLRVLETTNAYNFGCRLPDKQIEEYGLVQFPVGEDVTLVTYVRRGDEFLEDVAGYLRLLKDEVENRFI